MSSSSHLLTSPKGITEHTIDYSRESWTEPHQSLDCSRRRCARNPFLAHKATAAAGRLASNLITLPYSNPSLASELHMTCSFFRQPRRFCLFVSSGTSQPCCTIDASALNLNGLVIDAAGHSPLSGVLSQYQPPGQTKAERLAIMSHTPPSTGRSNLRAIHIAALMF